MQLIALVESSAHVCCRYRLTAYRHLLEQAGHSLEVRELPRPAWGWFHLGRELRRADAVILQRKLPQPWQLYLLRRAARRLIFDFDDAVFVRDSYAPKGLHSARRQRRFAAVIRSADAVVAGNAFLAAEAARWASEARIQVIPTCLDPTAYATADHTRAGKGVQLVWIGSSSTLRGLERARDLLDHISRAHQGLFLKVMCDRFLELAHLQVLPCRWSLAGEAAALAEADIGISWVPDDLWTRGKCGLKVLQYMAAGLPVVANPVGVQAEIVRHGETGFLATTTAEWVEAVGRLAQDPGLRRRMGQVGRVRVEANYGIAAGAARWRALLSGLERRRKSA